MDPLAHTELDGSYWSMPTDRRAPKPPPRLTAEQLLLSSPRSRSRSRSKSPTRSPSRSPSRSPTRLALSTSTPVLSTTAVVSSEASATTSSEPVATAKPRRPKNKASSAPRVRRVNGEHAEQAASSNKQQDENRYSEQQQLQLQYEQQQLLKQRQVEKIAVFQQQQARLWAIECLRREGVAIFSFPLERADTTTAAASTTATATATIASESLDAATSSATPDSSVTTTTTTTFVAAAASPTPASTEQSQIRPEQEAEREHPVGELSHSEPASHTCTAAASETQLSPSAAAELQSNTNQHSQQHVPTLAEAAPAEVAPAAAFESTAANSTSTHALYVGGKAAAKNGRLMRERRISAVVNCTTRLKQFFEGVDLAQRFSSAAVDANAAAPAPAPAPAAAATLAASDVIDEVTSQAQSSATSILGEATIATEMDAQPSTGGACEPATEERIASENATEEEEEAAPHLLAYWRVPVEDLPDENILRHLEAATDFIHSHVQRGRSVLVHCIQGQSRSPSVIIACTYQTLSSACCLLCAKRHLRACVRASPDAIRYQNHSLQDAYNHATQRNPYISINDGFKRQLMEFELRVRGCSSLDFFAKRSSVGVAFYRPIWGPRPTSRPAVANGKASRRDRKPVRRVHREAPRPTSADPDDSSASMSTASSSSSSSSSVAPRRAPKPEPTASARSASNRSTKRPHGTRKVKAPRSQYADWLAPRPSAVTHVTPDLACFLPPPEYLERLIDSSFDGSYWVPKPSARLARLNRRSASPALPTTPPPAAGPPAARQSDALAVKTPGASALMEIDEHVPTREQPSHPSSLHSHEHHHYQQNDEHDADADICLLDSDDSHSDQLSSSQEQGYRADESSQEYRDSPREPDMDLDDSSLGVANDRPLRGEGINNNNNNEEDDDDDDDDDVDDVDIDAQDDDDDDDDDEEEGEQVIVGWEQVDRLGRVVSRLIGNLDGSYWQQEDNTPRARRRERRLSYKANMWF